MTEKTIEKKNSSNSKFSSFSREFGILYAMIAMWVLVIVFSLALEGKFSFNWSAMLQTCSIVGFAAIGMTFCIISGNIDLSIGMMMSLLAVITITLLNLGWSAYIAFPVVIICGLIFGSLNGIFIAKVRIPPFIATLAMQYVFNAVARIISNETEVAFSAPWFSDIANGSLKLYSTKGMDVNLGKLLIDPFSNLPVVFLILIVFGVIGTWILRRTSFGRNVVAIGNSEKAARACGINIDNTKIGIYALLGAFTAISAIFSASNTGMAGSNIMKSAEFTAITACILGGTAMAGGKGNVGTTIIAAIFYQSITYCLSAFGLGTYIQMAVKGLILLIAVSMSNINLIISEFTRVRKNLKIAKTAGTQVDTQ